MMKALDTAAHGKNASCIQAHVQSRQDQKIHGILVVSVLPPEVVVDWGYKRHFM